MKSYGRRVYIGLLTLIFAIFFLGETFYGIYSLFLEDIRLKEFGYLLDNMDVFDNWFTVIGIVLTAIFTLILLFILNWFSLKIKPRLHPLLVVIPIIYYFCATTLALLIFAKLFYCINLYQWGIHY